MTSVLDEGLSSFLARAAVLGRRSGYACGLWGSEARGDVTPTSDVDIVCVSTSASPPYGDLLRVFRLAVSSSRRLDVLHLDSSEDLVDVALRSGTDLHGLFFTRNVDGDASLQREFIQARAHLVGRNDVRAREVLSLSLGWRLLAEQVAKDRARAGKFGLGGTNLWVRIAQVCQLRAPELVGVPLDVVTEEAAATVGLPVEDVRREWHHSMASRRTGCVNEDQAAPTTRKLFGRTLEALGPWLMEHARLTSSQVRAVASYCENGKLDDGIVPSSDGPSDALLQAFFADDIARLENLLGRAGQDWWLGHALAVNGTTPESVLERLFFLRPLVDPSWRTIRLYVAGHPNCGPRLANRVLACPGLREQDYSAARRRLLNAKPPCG